MLPADIQEQFLNFLNFDMRRNIWIENDSMKIYVRKNSVRQLAQQVVKTLDIATIEVYPEFRRKGLCSSFLTFAHEVNPYNVTYVECVHNEILRSHLIKNGYSLSSTPLCFYKFTLDNLET